jgi:hypothetical protein
VRDPRLFALRVFLLLRDRPWAKALAGLLLCMAGGVAVIAGAGHARLAARGAVLVTLAAASALCERRRSRERRRSG